jgi:quercetin dioxygenase-like cupin family protein
MNAYRLKIITTFLVIFITANAMAQDKIIRKELLTADVGTLQIRKVDVREIDFQPGQKTGYHKHPCPVVSYIVSGSVLFQIEGDTVRTLKAGEVIYEPANTPIAHYDNASQTEPLKFVAYYLINKETVLIEMLPQGTHP